MTSDEQIQSSYQKRASFFSRRRKEQREKRQAWLALYEMNIRRLHKSPAKKELALLKSITSAKKKALSAYDPSRYEIGFRAWRMNAKDGTFTKMPTEFAFILKACEELIDNKRRFPSLYQADCVAMNYRNVRIQMAKVLAVLLSNSDFFHGRVGTPSPEGMIPISYETIWRDYIFRWGEIISPKALRKCIKRLEHAGLFMSRRIYVQVQVPPSGKLDKRTAGLVTIDEMGIYEVRSSASYKQLTMQFFKELKVTEYKNVSQDILKTRKKKLAEGNLFTWMRFSQLASRLVTSIGGITLDKTNDLDYNSLTYARPPI